MDLPFAVAAEAVRDIARWERHRIEFVQWHALIGQVEPPPGQSLGGWRARLKGLDAGANILTILADHEVAARALDRRLALQLLCAPAVLPAPSMMRALTRGIPKAR